MLCLPLQHGFSLSRRRGRNRRIAGRVDSVAPRTDRLMATGTLFISSPSIMSKRAPLADIPNAVNSPNRAVAQIGTKRARSHAADQRELAYGQPPPAKRQLLQTEDHETRRNALLQKTSNQPPTTLQRRLEASRDGPRPAKTVPPNIEDIRQWQRHYRKVFPQIVFYFDNVPEDVRERVKRQVKSLGAVSRALRGCYCLEHVH